MNKDGTFKYLKVSTKPAKFVLFFFPLNKEKIKFIMILKDDPNFNFKTKFQHLFVPVFCFHPYSVM